MVVGLCNLSLPRMVRLRPSPIDEWTFIYLYGCRSTRIERKAWFFIGHTRSSSLGRLSWANPLEPVLPLE